MTCAQLVNKSRYAIILFVVAETITRGGLNLKRKGITADEGKLKEIASCTHSGQIRDRGTLYNDWVLYESIPNFCSCRNCNARCVEFNEKNHHR